MKDKLKALTTKVKKDHVVGVALLAIAYLAGKESEVVNSLFSILVP